LPVDAPQHRRVLGIDPGTIFLGYGFIVENQARAQLNVPASGVLRAPAHLALPERLLVLYTSLTALLERLQPTEVAVEEVFVGRNWRTALSLGHAQGIALLAAAQAGLPIATYAAATVKEAVSGFGGADKGQVQALVAQHLGLAAPPKPEHAADALAVALCHLWRSAFAQRLAQATIAHL
jgi:crossover junction endodeoxyribonuclease RuvC